MPPYAKQIDGNQNKIFKGLRARGVGCHSTAMVGYGFPDAVCDYQGLTVLAEIKLPQSPFVKGGKGGRRDRRPDEYDPQEGFTPDEVTFHAKWRGQPIATWRTLADALTSFGLD